MWSGIFGLDSEWKTSFGNPDPFPTVAPFGGARACRALGNAGEPVELRGWTSKARRCYTPSPAPVIILTDSRLGTGSPCTPVGSRSRGGSGFGDGFEFQPVSQRGKPPPSEDMDNMIHVASEIVGWPVDLMVDTGAQLSIMTLPLVQRLGMTSRIDQSEMGVASGVGTALIIGRLRAVPVRMGKVEIAMDFGVLHIKDSFAMLGMDQMQRFKCILDLDKRAIRFGGDLRGVEVPFMAPRGRRVSR
mmetsp:Transcript_35895/g.99519  ORF Transcript_35895/g.99519 Transcript_35895/m.99519 type:complete len:245 (-) Transcript_35895:3-737(-)